MPESAFPRMSEATQFLPMLRNELVHAATTHLYPVALTVNFRPIVEDRLFGFELDSDPAAPIQVVIGRTAQGEPVVRSSPPHGDARTIRLAMRDGAALPVEDPSRQELSCRPAPEERCFASWSEAAEQAWAALARGFAGEPVHQISISTTMEQSLEGALTAAYSHLAKWDPFVHFYGLPDEAQDGFRLSSAVPHENGRLILQTPNKWMLRWKASPEALYESWWSTAAEDIQLGRRADAAWAKATYSGAPPS